VEREQKNLSIAKRELTRSTQLLESGVASRLEYDEAKDKVDQARSLLEMRNQASIGNTSGKGCNRTGR
jgi:multidrug resistance efflux pump